MSAGDPQPSVTPLKTLALLLLARVLTWLAAAAMVAMMLWTVADVVLRAAFHKPLHGSVAFVETMLVLVAVLALAECLGRDEQIKVDVFDHILGKRSVFALKLLGDVAMLAFVALLAITMINPMVDAWRFWDIKPDIPVPIFVLLAVIEASLVVAALVLTGKTVRFIRNGIGCCPSLETRR